MYSLSRSQSWKVAAVSILAVLFIIGSVYRETATYLISIWNEWEEGDYGHGYLVIAISGYLIFYRRSSLAGSTPSPSLFAIVPLLLSVIAWLMAMLTDVRIVQSAAILGLLIASIWAILGWRVVRLLAFPLLFMALALPIWSVISPLLQDITAEAVFYLIGFIDIPALKQENYIVLPAGSLAIQEACSGLRFVLAATTLGALFAYMNYSSVYARTWIIAIAIASAITMNVVRVMIVVILAYETDMQHPLVKDHLSLGWYLFAAMVVLLLFLEYMVSRDGKDTHVDTASNRREAGTIYNGASGSIRQFWILSLIIPVLLSGPIALQHYRSGYSGGQPADIISLPAGNGGWQGPFTTEESWEPAYRGAKNLKRIYRKPGQSIFVHVAHYSSQSQGRELINDLNRVSDTGEWVPAYLATRQADVGDRKVLSQMLVSTDGEKRLVYYWYNVAGLRTINPYMAKVYQLYGIIVGNAQAAAITLAADIREDDQEQAHQYLEQFIELHQLALDDILRRSN